MIAPLYRSYSENTQVIDITLIGNGGGKTTFKNTLLGNQTEEKGTRILYANDKKITLHISTNPDLSAIGERIGFVVCNTTVLARLLEVDAHVETLKKNNISRIYLLATFADKAFERSIPASSLEFKAQALNLAGVVEVNCLDKRDLKEAVRLVVADILKV